MEHHLALAVELFNRTIKFFWLLWAKLTCFDLFVTDRNLTGASSLQRLWLLRWIWCLILLLQLVTWGDWGLPYSLWSWSLQMAWLWKRLWRFWTIFKVGWFLFLVQGSLRQGKEKDGKQTFTVNHIRFFSIYFKQLGDSGYLRRVKLLSFLCQPFCSPFNSTLFNPPIILYWNGASENLK